MRVVIIGGSGHVGTYLVPRLVEAGQGVINLSRGQREPYQPRCCSLQAVYESVHWPIAHGVIAV
ncbi:MAG TPA: hypothetical protein VFB21_15675 [Chthonomonadaceae bacterium]|nr:hypothetical protein [Chthonomonadaceae bacterium]